MASGGATSFADYIRSVFPQVAATVESLVTTVGHLIAGLAPLGTGVLSEIKIFSDLLGSIPVGVLQVLAQLAGPVFLGFKAWSGISSIVASASVSLEGMGRSAGVAAAGVRGLELAAGPLGIGLAALSLLVSHNAEANRQYQQNVDDLTSALVASNGALTENVRLTQYKQLVDDGAIQAAKELGISLDTVTTAALGNADASKEVAARMQAVIQAQAEQDAGGKATGRTWAEVNDAVGKLTNGLGIQTGALQAAQQAQQDQKAAMTDSTAATSAAAAAAQRQATNAANAAQAVRDYTLAHESSTRATKDEASAIQALNTQLDAELGKALALAGSQTAVDSATLAVVAALKKNKGAMSEHSAAGVDDRQKIEGVVSALQRHRDVLIQNGTPITTATRQYQDGSKALLDQIGKLDGTKSAAYKYAQQLLAIPKNVKTTIGLSGVSTVVGGLSQIQRLLNQMPTSKVVHILVANGSSVAAATSQIGQSNRASQHTAQAYGGIQHFDGGGFLDGPLPRSATIAKDGANLINWAEPGTGDEAFIPLAPSRRSSSVPIWEEAGRRLGMGAGGGKTDLSDATLQRLAGILRGMPVHATVAVGSVDRAMGRV